MKILRLCFFFTMLTLTSIAFATRVDPQTTDGVRMLMNKMGLVSDEWTPIPILDPSGTIYTISTSGNYQLVENATGQVVIDADDVCLNLNGYELIHSDADEHIITVNSNKKNVKIYNGLLNNSSGPGLGCGILVNTGCNMVKIAQMQISNCGNGIKLDGIDGNEVFCCKVNACDFISNTTGIQLYYADENFIEACSCRNGLQAGFELLQSEANCLINCQTIETENLNATALGFSSRDGNNNLFKNCAAKNTKTDAWEFCNKSYGFLLTGTETKTKIIDCVVNETDMTSTVSAVSYGIHLEPILHDYSNLLSLVSTNTCGNTFFEVAWSPDGKYIAVTDNKSLSAFLFDGSTYLSHIDTIIPSANQVYSVDWSPNGEYIAFSQNTSGEVYVVGFSESGLSFITNSAAIGASTNIVRWSPNGKYIASGDNNNYIRVFNFDGTSITEIDNDNTPGALVLCAGWSPNGKYIATGDLGGVLRIFSFDGKQLTLIDSYTTSIRTVTWSPNGKFLTIGDGSNNVRVFSFDGTTIIPIDSYTQGGQANGLDWSPNGKYIAAVDQNGNILNVYAFDGSNIIFIDSTIAGGGATLNTVKWSPGGRYIATGDSNTNLRVFDAMYGPENCLVKNNAVCDTWAYGQFIGTGIAGCVGNNGIICNSCSNNEVNYSYGIPNVYDTYTFISPDLSDNIACN